MDAAWAPSHPVVAIYHVIKRKKDKKPTEAK